ncbi:hypothetical protein LT493_35305 [Streptomyces tricolor]|nr:hypothetical protein [Streptomyces tricolor]
MQKKSGLRGVHAGWYAGVAVLVVGLVAAVLYGSGAYDSWRDGRSLDEACDGTLAQGRAGLGAGLLGPEGPSRATAAPWPSAPSRPPPERDAPCRSPLRWSTTAAPAGHPGPVRLGLRRSEGAGGAARERLARRRPPRRHLADHGRARLPEPEGQGAGRLR